MDLKANSKVLCHLANDIKIDIIHHIVAYANIIKNWELMGSLSVIKLVHFKAAGD